MKQGKEEMKKLKGVFGLVLALGLLLILAEYANSAVLKMPKPLPDIVKSYKSVLVKSVLVDFRDPDMNNSGVEVGQEDFITILAKGMIDTWPSSVASGSAPQVALRTIDQSYQEGFRLGPKRLLLIRIGERDPAEHYKGPDIVEVFKEGKIYLGYRGSEVDSSGEPLKPRYFDDDLGSFEVDIIVWKKNDPVFLGKFLDEASKAQPKDKELKEIVQEFKKRQEVLAGLQEKTKGVEKIKKEPKEKLPDSTSPVIKMPKPLPDIVKSYKSVLVKSVLVDFRDPDMNNSGVQVKQGDYITIFAKGIINFSQNSWGPKSLLMYQLGKKDSIRQYNGPEMIEIREDESIYLGYKSPPGATGASLMASPHTKGLFYVDIIVWKTKDPNLMAKFLEETSLSQPKDKELKEMVQEFKKRQEVLVALQERTKEVEEIKKELSIIETKEISEIKKEEKKVEESKGVIRPPVKEPITEQKVAKKLEEKPIPPVVHRPQEEKKIVTPLKEKEISEIKENAKEKRLQDLEEKLKKALQAVKELEEMKGVLARLESMEVERSKQPKNLPVIAIGYPKDGITLDSEYVNLYGMAEHEKGIQKFEILVNNKPMGLRDRGDLQIKPKDRKRIEFSERIRLQEGQNTISVVVQGTEGLTTQKTLSVLLAKKREEVYAVVIGINKYKNLPSLKYATNDAREFYRYLTEVNQVPKDRIWLLMDEEATLDKIRSTLATSLRRSAGKDDTVIIFLAGHGATEKDATSPDGDGLEKYILPHNADPKDLYTTALPMGEIARIFQRINSERLVFISDTCYSGASGGRTIPVVGTRTNVSGAFLERLSQGKGRVILTASDANEVSVEKDELKHGVFTYYLLEGLRGKADFDKDGVVTVDEVYRYVSIKVPQATEQDQHPVKKGETTGQIILGVVK